MNTLIFIGLLGVFAYHSSSNGNEFNGSSASAKSLLLLSGTIGYIVYIVTLIWSFWHFTWWQPILTALLTTLVISPITAPLFQRNILGIVFSPLAVIILSILSIMGLVG